MNKKYYACVFGGASDKIDQIHIKEVERLGKVITDNDFGLVYGAGASGCMGAVARGVDENDGYIMGISPHFIKDFEPIYECDNTVMVYTMAERKMLMERHADIFIIAPGGVGTMDEFFQVLTLKYLNRIHAPIIILNHKGFYDKLIELLESLAEQKAVSYEVFKLFDVVETADDEVILNYLKEIHTK